MLLLSLRPCLSLAVKIEAVREKKSLRCLFARPIWERIDRRGLRNGHRDKETCVFGITSCSCYI